MFATRSVAETPWRRWLRGEIGRFSPKIATVPFGRVFSVSLRFPDMLAQSLAGTRGDWVWRTSDRSVSFCGRGVVGEELDVEGWRSLRRDMVVLGASGPPQSAFLLAPPLGNAVRIRLPESLLRVGREGAWLYLSGRRDRGRPFDWDADFAETAGRVTPPRSAGGFIQALTPDFATWRDQIEDAVAAIGKGCFSKIVLARQMTLTAAAPFDADRLLRSMTEAKFAGRQFKIPWQGGVVVADSPELLVEKRGDLVVSHALAGTTRRYDDPSEDGRAAADMLASPKERREHEIVARYIADALGGLCDDVSRAPTPAVMRLSGLQHLWTPVSGRLRPGIDLFDTIGALHPTPAVLGFPREAARAWLARVEAPRDGLYTGLAGWVDLDGDGEAAVVLRSAFLRGRDARLWAGAGIVADSHPGAEWAETQLKMERQLRLVEEQA